jgi:hypothetical protein
MGETARTVRNVPHGAARVSRMLGGQVPNHNGKAAPPRRRPRTLLGVHFTVEQALGVPAAVAEEALVDESFYAAMGAIGPIGTPEVLHREDEGDRVALSVRYRFTGNLSSAARAVLHPEKLTWVIESTLRRSAHEVDFRMLPDHYGDRLSCAGTYRFEERAGGPVQVVDGDLAVHVLIVGRAVERAILMGLRQHLTEEAKLITRWAAGRR